MGSFFRHLTDVFPHLGILIIVIRMNQASKRRSTLFVWQGTLRYWFSQVPGPCHTRRHLQNRDFHVCLKAVARSNKYLLIIVGSATLSTLSTRFKVETKQMASLLRQIGAQDWPVSNCNNQSSSNSEKRGTHLHTICTRAWIPWCGPYESHLRWKPQLGSKTPRMNKKHKGSDLTMR